MPPSHLPVLSTQQVREIDRIAIEDLGIPGLVLMENAGRGVADRILSASPRKVLICCGAGNNGGDGFVIARHLDRNGIQVHVLVVCGKQDLVGDAAANFAWLAESRVTIQWVENCMPASIMTDANPESDWIIDALLGTGSRGAPRPPFDQVIHEANQIPVRKLAVDLPSGLDAETGVAASPTFRADETATFVVAKPGLMVSSARQWVGKLHIHGIGVPSKVLAKFGLTR